METKSINESARKRLDNLRELVGFAKAVSESAAKVVRDAEVNLWEAIYEHVPECKGKKATFNWADLTVQYEDVGGIQSPESTHDH